MFIEITIGEDSPRLHKLSKSTSLLGSKTESDICVQNKEVSRRHLSIILEEDRCFLIDLGSTNGTFINDLRINPGQKTEWTRFTPLRLGSKVLITLLEDDEVSGFEGNEISIPLEESQQEKTRTISRTELNKIKTETLVKKKAETRSPRKKQQKISKKDFKHYVLIGFALASFIAFDRWDEIRKSFEDPELAQAEAPPAPRKKAKVIRNPKKVEPELLIDKKILATGFEDPKCVEDDEKKICDGMTPKPENNFGVRKLSSMLLVYVDGGALIAEAKEFLNNPEETDVHKLAGLLYFYRSFSSPELQEIKHDSSISFIFYDSGEIKFVMSLKPEFVPTLRKDLHSEHFILSRRIGMSAFNYTNDYLTIY